MFASDGGDEFDVTEDSDDIQLIVMMRRMTKGWHHKKREAHPLISIAYPSVRYKGNPKCNFKEKHQDDE